MSRKNIGTNAAIKVVTRTTENTIFRINSVFGNNGAEDSAKTAHTTPLPPPRNKISLSPLLFTEAEIKTEIYLESKTIITMKRIMAILTNVISMPKKVPRIT